MANITLPDGTIVILDGLVTLMQNNTQVLAVLSHELGHAYHRHGLQTLLRSSIVTPARTCVGTTGLAVGATVEIDLIVGIPSPV